MSKKKTKDDVALEIASRMGHLYANNYSDGVVETAKLYKELTGIDLGIKSFQETADRVNKRTWFYKLKRFLNPLKKDE